MASTHLPFKQPVLLRQSTFWSKTILWGIIGATSLTVTWAAVFQIEEAIPATGKLEPEGAVKEVQAPVAGVVKEILVKDGQKVKEGEVLMRFDTTAAQSQVTSQTQIREALLKEIEFYQSQIRGETSSGNSEMNSLKKTRDAIAAETDLYRTQLDGTAPGNLTTDQQRRLQVRQAELDSRLASANLQMEQTEQQMKQAEVRLVQAQETLAINEGILNKMRPLAEEGGIAQVQLLKQEQEVLKQRSEVTQTTQERERLRLAIDEAKEKYRNAEALSQEDMFTKITSNEKNLAETDTQAAKVILDNQKRIAEIDSQLSQAKLTLNYQELRAPVSGTIFELKAGNGFVASPSAPVLKIVPDDSLVAKVFITNKDIGFVKDGMDTDVRLDSFPFQEFGDVKGQLIWIGSDALPPEQIRPYYHFPAKIRLKQQTLSVNGREVPLQSGMSINTNIKIRKRTILSMFTELFVKQVDSLKFVR